MDVEGEGKTLTESPSSGLASVGVGEEVWRHWIPRDFLLSSDFKGYVDLQQCASL